MARSLAEKHGLRATFMPKPFASLTGSGCHAHLSLHDVASGKNLCGGGAPEQHGLSPLSLSFLAGMLEHAPGARPDSAPDGIAQRPADREAAPSQSADTCQRRAAPWACCCSHVPSPNPRIGPNAVHSDGGADQPDGQLVQAPRRAHHRVGCHLVAHRRHVRQASVLKKGRGATWPRILTPAPPRPSHMHMHMWCLAAPFPAQAVLPSPARLPRKTTQVGGQQPHGAGARAGRRHSMAKVPPWWRHSWPPEAHESASEGLRLPYALGRRGPHLRSHQTGLTPMRSHALDADLAAFDHTSQAPSGWSCASPTCRPVPT